MQTDTKKPKPMDITDVRLTTIMPSQEIVDRLIQISNAIHESHTDLPPGCHNAYAIFRKLLTGVELGLPPMAAMNEVQFVNGQATLTSRSRVAIIRQRNIGTVDLVESTPEFAKIRITKPEWSQNRVEYITWTIEEAKNAGLLKKTNWRNYPEDMLVARAIGRGTTRFFQEIFVSAGYSPDELGAETNQHGDLIEAFIAPTVPWATTDKTVTPTDPSPKAVTEDIESTAQKIATAIKTVAEQTDADKPPEPVEQPPEPATTSAYKTNDHSPERTKELVAQLEIPQPRWKMVLANHFDGATGLGELTEPQRMTLNTWLLHLHEIGLMRKEAGYDEKAWKSVLDKRGAIVDFDLTPQDVETIWGKLYNGLTAFQTDALGIKGPRDEETASVQKTAKNPSP